MYKGDKLNFTVFDYNGADTQHTGVIDWDDNAMHWYIRNGDDEFFGSDYYSLGWVCEQCDEVEVVGTIHDAELLGVKQIELTQAELDGLPF